MKRKIKIFDNNDLRDKIIVSYNNLSHKEIAEKAIRYIDHICEITNCLHLKDNELIKNAIKVNKLWQMEKSRMHDVRQEGFKVHKIARESDSDLEKSVLRTIGHCVASGHMKEHFIVALDYAIKSVNLISGENITLVNDERMFQINLLNSNVKTLYEKNI